MKTTFIDTWNEKVSLIGKMIFSYDDGRFTINDNNFIMKTYNSLVDLAEDLELNDREIDLLMHDNGYINERGILI